MISPAHRDVAYQVAVLIERESAKATLRPWDALLAGLVAGLRDLFGRAADALAYNIRHLGQGTVEDPLFWQHFDAEVQDELAAGLGQIARLGAVDARAALPSVTVQVNWGLVNQNAVTAAQTQVGELITGIDATTREAVREAVAEWVQSGQPLDALTEKIRGLGAFSEQRARLIAQTESTNAYAIGNAQAWEAAGVLPAAFKPSAHVGCRCYLQPFRLENGQTVMVWYTAQDERVCTQPIETPWGTVGGCRELHDTIVSAGPWMGTSKP